MADLHSEVNRICHVITIAYVTLRYVCVSQTNNDCDITRTDKWATGTCYWHIEMTVDWERSPARLLFYCLVLEQRRRLFARRPAWFYQSISSELMKSEYSVIISVYATLCSRYRSNIDLLMTRDNVQCAIVIRQFSCMHRARSKQFITALGPCMPPPPHAY